ITYRYYKKAAAEQKEQLERLQSNLRPRNTLADFEHLLESSRWTKTLIDRRTIWVCDDDNTFQVEEGQQTREFRERWTTVYPDPNSSASPVYLRIGPVVVKELTFISMDGHRIFVPMPELRPLGDEEVEYFWNRNSLDVKVCRIIGQYYIYENLDGVARRSRVAIVE
ncbi:MAG: hypothetical protein IMZ69_04010, partial [Spirochaetes bacterium]|nr:hypothetical protein [Spirochaetota bacterium]